MNFSELFKQNRGLCKFSPNGQFVANGVQYKLVIRDCQQLQISNLFACLDVIEHIQWSPDSQLILCGMYKRSLIQVWSLNQPEWTCKIDEGAAGLQSAVFSPDSRHILSIAEFSLRITVWSLVNKSVSYLKFPKSIPKAINFTSDGCYMALAERRDCKDHISILACKSWNLLKNFQIDTNDMAGLAWSSNGHILCVWDSVLDYKVLLYSLDGRPLMSYSAYDNALGIKSVAWSPSGQFLSIGSYDQMVRLLNNITWKPVARFLHSTSVDSEKVVVYKETEKRPFASQPLQSAPAVSNKFAIPSKYEIYKSQKINIPNVIPDPEKPDPKLGVGVMVFSADSRYLATINDNMPKVVWLYSVAKLTLSVVLIQAAAVKAIAWDPIETRLALCTGNNKIYVWTPAGCMSVDIPCEATFQVLSLEWHPQGRCITLIGKDNMCICYFDQQSDEKDKL
ncbi:WD repeat-containing protein WRAP73 [Trichoplax sp. H2]|nr:WD repeat-containing protein WRAP73 [Trichoplax sp. H2]|eukprot:RDD42428.1 WD repeat-containing protein WRAP73 [Trichoplax sp. H2]